MKSFGYSLAAFLLLSSCAQVRVTVPNPRVESPELRGDPGFTIGTGVYGAHVYQSTDDGANRPPPMDDPRIDGAVGAGVGAQYSPASPFSFGLEGGGPIGTGGSATFRFQVAGEGHRSAEAGNVPVLLYLRLGGAYSSRSGNQESTFGAGGYNWQGNIKAGFAHAGASMGYRVAPHTLLYWGLAAGHIWTRSEVNQDPHTGTGDPGGTYVRSDPGQAYTGGFGAMFNWTKVQFFFNAELTHYDYRHTDNEIDPFLHAGVTFTP